MTLAVLVCERCGAALPLVAGPRATCSACGTVRELPDVYVAHQEYARRARETRRAAERAYRKLVSRSISERTPGRFAMFGIPALVVGIPALLWFTQDLCGWALRTWVVFAVFFPLLFGCLMLAGLSALADPSGYLHAIGGRIRPGAPTPSGTPTCGACGAPLVPEPDALSATCDYCLADSWLVAIDDEHVEGAARERANLDDLVRAASFMSFDIRLFVLVSLVIAGGFLLFLWIGFS